MYLKANVKVFQMHLYGKLVMDICKCKTVCMGGMKICTVKTRFSKDKKIFKSSKPNFHAYIQFYTQINLYDSYLLVFSDLVAFFALCSGIFTLPLQMVVLLASG